MVPFWEKKRFFLLYGGAKRWNCIVVPYSNSCLKYKKLKSPCYTNSQIKLPIFFGECGKGMFHHNSRIPYVNWFINLGRKKDFFLKGKKKVQKEHIDFTFFWGRERTQTTNSWEVLPVLSSPQQSTPGFDEACTLDQNISNFCF